MMSAIYCLQERRARLAQHLDHQIRHIAKQVHAAVSGSNAPAYEGGLYRSAAMIICFACRLPETNAP